MYEQFMGDFTYRDQASRQVQLFSSFIHFISISLPTVMCTIIKPIFYFAVRKFVCTPGATTNIYGHKYEIQGQFSKSQGKCSNHFA